MLKDIVCICGANEMTRDLVDWSLDAEFWVFNEAAYTGEIDPKRWNYGKPITGAFQMHAPEIWRSDNGGHFDGYYEWLKKKHDYPIWMIDNYQEVPSSVKYPFREIVEFCLENRLVDETGQVIELFTSTMDYMLALAIFQGRKEIRFFGVEAASGTEYERQREGIAFWIGVAVGSGIKIVRQSKSQLLNKPLYGYTGEIMIGRQRFELAASQLEREVIRSQTEMFEAQGKVKAILNALMQTQSQEDAERLQGEFLAALNEAQETVFTYALASGRFGENKRYMAECDKLIEAAGGDRAAEILNSNADTNPSSVAAELVNAEELVNQK